MSLRTLGALAGLMAGLGLWLTFWTLYSRRPRLVSRIAPYLRERSSTSGLLRPVDIHSPFPVVESLLAPVMADIGNVLSRLGSSPSSIRRRLPQAGGGSLEQFRVEQVMCGVLGLASGLAFALLAGVARGLSPVVGLLVVLLCGAAGALGRDYWLTRRVKRRQHSMLLELPAIAEMLALAVSAGEDPAAAIARAARSGRGVLSEELNRVIAATRAGSQLVTALEDFLNRTTQPAVSRFVEAVATAVDRGTPLAEVLRAQAQDAREAARRELMELGGKKEVAMMAPVVFIVLPTTVLFALFPGLALLQVGL